MSYRQFIFEACNFDTDTKMLSLHYSLDDRVKFTETYRFTFDFIDYQPEALQRACETLFLMAGVSYYKTYLPPEIVISKDLLVDETTAGFLSRTYQQGLGEFFYVNQLDPRTVINFPANSPPMPSASGGLSDGMLIGIGGGKDSLVTAEILRRQPRVATWSLNHRPQLQPLVERIGLPHFYVEREWDKQLLDLNRQDAYNGHVPISAIFACVGAIVSILTGYRDHVVSNEASASENTLDYQGVMINHQYSKSLAFEADFQALLAYQYRNGPRYYSFLRPLSEVFIGELFAQYGFSKYHDVFSSCNRAFTHDSDHIFWDASCPKCAFVFLALTPFVSQASLEALFNKNLLLDAALEPTYRQLLGIEGDKPLECVGEIAESRAAMRFAQRQYPTLTKYEFDIPSGYNYRALREHRMPPEVFSLLVSKLRLSGAPT